MSLLVMAGIIMVGCVIFAVYLIEALEEETDKKLNLIYRNEALEIQLDLTRRRNDELREQNNRLIDEQIRREAS